MIYVKNNKTIMGEINGTQKDEQYLPFPQLKFTKYFTM